MNIAELAEHSAERLGDRLVLDFEGQRFTNHQQLHASRQLHFVLSDLGFQKGDVAAICMANHPSIYPVFGGIFRTGGTALPTMFMLPESELRFILRDSQAKGVFTDKSNLDKIRKAVSGLAHIKWIMVLGGQKNTAKYPPEYRLEDFFKGAPQNSLPDIHDDDTALILYTAGTTGKPKGVILTHGNLYASAETSVSSDELDLLERPRIKISAMPMAHIFGIAIMNAGYLMPERLADTYSVQLSWFDAEKFMQQIVQHRCNVMIAVPTMLTFLLNHPKIDDYDLSCLEEVICGAAPLPVELANTFSNKYDCIIRQNYGQTESAGIGARNFRSKPYKLGSVGTAYHNVDLCIVDELDQPVPCGEIGEIVIRGKMVMKGYLNQPEETEAALKKGWLHTGDLGYLDEDGYLFVVDRKKDMIIKGGENIYPAEIEEVLYDLSQVAEAAVVGVPDPLYGEQVVAFIVVRTGMTLTKEEVIAHVAAKKSKFKSPGKIFFVEGLPKSAVGKNLKKELRKIAVQLNEI